MESRRSLWWRWNPPPISSIEDSPTKEEDVKPLYSHIKQDVVTISVGIQQVRYYIHRELLSSKSLYFAARFKKCWDGKAQEICLPNHQEDVFDNLTVWLYKGELPDTLFGPEDQDRPFVGARAMRLYKLADEIMMIDLKNDVVLAMTDYSEKTGNFFDRQGYSYAQELELTHTRINQFLTQQLISRHLWEHYNRPTTSLEDPEESKEDD